MLEIGEYIRTNTGKIIKVSTINQNFTYKDIVAHSQNLIELIAIDDYVNGHRVMSVDKESNLVYCDTTGYETPINSKDIKNILTKETYQENCYDVNLYGLEIK